MNRKYLIVLPILLVANSFLHSQNGFSHEIGVITGPIAFQSDYGERYDFDTNKGNVGFGIGIIHYWNFSDYYSCNCRGNSGFSEHFKLRSEISWSKTKFKHYGRWVAPEKVSLAADQLRAMKGESTLLNLGTQLEYYPFNLRDFYFGNKKFAPYINLGVQFSRYNPKASSTIGVLGTSPTTHPKYINGFTNDSGTVWSIVGGFGTRYKINYISDFLIDMRWQYYFSNWVDGLNPPNAPEDKVNDWTVWFNIGYVFYLN